MALVTIEKMDSMGRGIGYLDGKIIFIPKTTVGDICEISIVKEKKNCMEGKLLRIVTPGKLRVVPKCPYFSLCGGCDLQHITYEESILWKKNMLEDLFQRSHLWNQEIEIEQSSCYFYRNKISLKVVSGKIGFFSYDSHQLVEISKCMISHPIINEVLKDFSLYSFLNGEIVIRVNYNDEVLMNFITKEVIHIQESFFSRHKVVGICINGKCIYGNSYFFERVNGVLYQVSFDSFFQVNSFISKKLFLEVRSLLQDKKNILDLYCGVGTLGLQIPNASITGIEVVQNAILNAIKNASLNHRENCFYHLGDVSSIVSKLPSLCDAVIVDPPRSGITKNTIHFLMSMKVSTIVYISCNPSTLVRDLKNFISDYNISLLKAFDMFPYTKHVECVCVLNRR